MHYSQPQAAPSGHLEQLEGSLPSARIWGILWLLPQLRGGTQLRPRKTPRRHYRERALHITA